MSHASAFSPSMTLPAAWYGTNSTATSRRRASARELGGQGARLAGRGIPRRQNRIVEVDRRAQLSRGGEIGEDCGTNHGNAGAPPRMCDRAGRAPARHYTRGGGLHAGGTTPGIRNRRIMRIAVSRPR